MVAIRPSDGLNLPMRRSWQFKAFILPKSRNSRAGRADSREPPRRGGTMQCRPSSSWRAWRLVLGLLIIASAATSEALASADDSKIDRGLMARLTDEADAVAPFFVVFGERADLKAAYRIADRGP